jgi:hypothetical protein
MSLGKNVYQWDQIMPVFSLNVFYLSQNNKFDRTQVQRTYEVFSYIQFYNNTNY